MITIYSNKIILYVTIILILISFKSFSKDEILFTILEKPYTTIDYENRIKYLRTINQNNNIVKDDEILNDFISVLIFNQFAKNKKIEVEKEKIDKYIENFDLNNLSISIDILKRNIRYDYQRKIILESIITNDFNKNLKKDKIKILDLYKINLKYFVIDKEYSENISKIEKNIKNINIEQLKKYFKNENINYDYYEKKILNIDTIDPEIKDNILNDKKYFKIYKNYILLGFLEKKIKNNIKIQYTLYQITKEKRYGINLDELKCENIDKYKDNKNLKIKEYDKMDINKLNIKIKENLKSINDIIKIDNSQDESYIILCKIDYDYEILEREIFNEKLDYLASQIEKDFIGRKKIEYNFKFND